MTTNPPPYGYPSPPPAYVQPSAPARRSGLWIAVAAFVAGAVIAGVIVYFVRPDSDGSSTSSDSVTLPKRAGPLTLFADVRVPDDRKDQQAKNAAAQQKEADSNAKRLAGLHDGAGTAVSEYASSDLKTLVSVTAVRTKLDPLYVDEADASRLGLAVPIEVTKTYGDVTCIVHNPTTTQGGTPDSSQVFAEVCQRSSARLTVQLRGSTNTSPSAAAKLTDDVFDAIR